MGEDVGGGVNGAVGEDVGGGVTTYAGGDGTGCMCERKQVKCEPQDVI